MWTKILLIFFVFSFLFRTDHSFDQDLGRHLKLGEIIWQTRAVPKTNLFSYTNPDFPFINTHWLFEVWVYLTSQTAGLQTLLLVKIVLFLFSVYLIFKIIPKGNQALLLPVAFIFLHLLRERAELRPEIFSFLFTATTYYILEKYLRGPTKLIFLLPLIQLIWINTHIYFFVGLILQAIFLIHLGLRYLRSRLDTKKIQLLGIIFVLSAIVSLINPNGISGFLYPLNVTNNYGYTIVENQTIFLLESINFRDPNFVFAKISLGLIALSLLITFLRRKFELKNVLITVFGMALALMNVRSLPYLVFLSFPAILLNFGPIKYTPALKILFIIFGMLLILESYFYLNGNYYRFRDDYNSVNFKLVESGKGAMDFVLNNNLPGPIYNNFDIGSYIIYRGLPKYPVFIDGRPEAYPAEFFLRTYIPTQSDYAKFQQLQSKLDFKTIIFSHTDQTPWGKAFLASVVKDNDWKTVYIDDFMIVSVTSDVAIKKSLKIIDLSKLNAADFKFDNHRSYLNLTVFLLSTGNQQAAATFVTKTLQLFPESPVANSMIGNQVESKFFW